MDNLYHAIYFDSVTDFLQALPPKDRSKIERNFQVMQGGDLQSPRIKTLRSPVKELIVKEYRILFFIHARTIHFVRAFRKKSMKTPKSEIEYVERVCKVLTQ